MMKYFFITFLAACSLCATAQTAGMWKSHPKYVGSGAQNLVDAGSRIYLQSSNHLFAFDKASTTIAPLDKDNGANDLVVTNIFYNSDDRYTVVAYNNSNIDVIMDDGRVVNIPDIKDAIYNGAKGINDVTFAGGMMYVATQFGLVIVDGSNMQVRHTYYYDRNLSSAAMVGQVLVVAHDDELYFDTRTHHDNFAQFEASGLFYASPRITPINNEKFFLRSLEALEICTLEVANAVSVSTETVVFQPVDNVQHLPGGFIANSRTASRYYTFDANGENMVTTNGGNELYSCNPHGDGTMWAVGTNGVHIKGDATYHTPNGWGITENAFWSAYNPGDGKVYVSRTTDNGLISKYSGVVTEIWTYDGSQWANATPHGRVSNYGNYWPVFEPGHKCSYFYSTRGASYIPTGGSRTYYGIISHVVNDTVVQNFDGRTNSPLTFMNALAMDKDGNLWGVQSFRSAAEGPYVVALPHDKLHKPGISHSDWVTPNLSGKTGSNKASTIAISRGSDIKVFSIGSYNGPLLFWDNEGDVYNMNPRNVTYSSLPDADGSTVGWQFIRCLTPDTLGNIWAGTTSGFLYFNPAEAFEPGFKVNRIKIKMNPDSETDYFLDGEDVHCIAVDSLNRKWLGTATQGVFLLSADSKKVLAQFDANNSSLPSNNIYTICPKPNSNSVIFVTSEGIAEYLCEATTTVSDYDNVQAFPNPMRPHYTGYITISNLVNDSFVKIVDRQGNTVAQMQAQGTTAKWDGCDEHGERLPTGVYYVHAGSDALHLSTHAVTQIRLIK